MGPVGDCRGEMEIAGGVGAQWELRGMALRDEGLDFLGRRTRFEKPAFFLPGPGWMAQSAVVRDPGAGGGTTAGDPARANHLRMRRLPPTRSFRPSEQILAVLVRKPA
jgi:hypothetical protein